MTETKLSTDPVYIGLRGLVSMMGPVQQQEVERLRLQMREVLAENELANIGMTLAILEHDALPR